MVDIEDLVRYRDAAYRNWPSPTSRTIVDLCDEVEALRWQLGALVADNNRLRAQVSDLLLADNAGSNLGDISDELGR